MSSGSQNYSQYPFSQLDDSQLTQDFGSQQSGEVSVIALKRLNSENMRINEDDLCLKSTKMWPATNNEVRSQIKFVFVVTK